MKGETPSHRVSVHEIEQIVAVQVAPLVDWLGYDLDANERLSEEVSTVCVLAVHVAIDARCHINFGAILVALVGQHELLAGV